MIIMMIFNISSSYFTKNLSLLWRLFNDETDLSVKYLLCSQFVIQVPNSSTLYRICFAQSPPLVSYIIAQKRRLHWVYCGSVGKFRSLGHVTGSILGVSLTWVFLLDQSKSYITKRQKKDVSTNYYLMLVLITERAHSHCFFPLSKGDIWLTYHQYFWNTGHFPK